MSLQVSRQVSLPLILSSLLVCGVIALLTMHIAYEEFFQLSNYWKLSRLPPTAEALHQGYKFAWLLPLIFLIWSVFLLRRPSVSATTLAWYLSCFFIAVFLWLILCFMAAYSIYEYIGHVIGGSDRFL